ncbi:MAG: hypothetical protein ACTHW2_05765 [Tissierella sp.]|uniref:hypothetical protein n=1 Tax=Tissierella sp. TaxID=41274 RepID=UPI003F9714F1
MEKPVFFKNYIEEAVYTDEEVNSYLNEFTVRYITNINDDRRVVDIEFEGQDMDLYINDSNLEGEYPNFFIDTYDEGTYGRYTIKNLLVRPNLDLAYTDFKGVELSKANIIFDNGDSLNADLGRMIYYEKPNYYEDRFIEHGASGSSSDDTGYSNVNIKEDLVVEKLDSRLLDNVKDNLEITIGDRDYKSIKGTQLKKGDSYSMNYREKFIHDPIEKYNTYKVSLNLYFQDKDGGFHDESIGSIWYQPFEFNLLDIIKYLRARGELKW